MQVILDIHVLLAALISLYGFPDEIYKAWRAGRFKLVTSNVQIDELRRLSRYPKLEKILPAHRAGTMINNMHWVLLIDPLPSLSEDVNLEDPDDVFLLAMALATDADHLITGDH